MLRRSRNPVFCKKTGFLWGRKLVSGCLVSATSLSPGLACWPGRAARGVRHGLVPGRCLPHRGPLTTIRLGLSAGLVGRLGRLRLARRRLRNHPVRSAMRGLRWRRCWGAAGSSPGSRMAIPGLRASASPSRRLSRLAYSGPHGRGGLGQLPRGRWLGAGHTSRMRCSCARSESSCRRLGDFVAPTLGDQAVHRSRGSVHGLDLSRG